MVGVLRVWTAAACLLASAWATEGQAGGPREVVLALRADRPEEALRLLAPHLERAPKDPTLLTLQGVGLAALGRVEESLRAYDAALQVRPDLLPALQGAAELEYRGRKPGARGRLERIVAVDPANAVAHAMLGALAYEREDCAAAVRHFAAGRPSLQENAAALWQFGVCLLLEARSAEAADVFGQLLPHADRRDAGPVRFAFALALHEAGRHGEAVSALEPLGAGAAGPEPLGLLADAYRANGQLDEAVAVLRRATRLFPTDEESYVALVALCLEHESFDLAREIAAIGLRHIPGSARLHALRGVAHALAGEYDSALAEFERAAAIDPRHPASVGGLSLTLQQTGRYEESLDVLRRAAVERPGDPAANLLFAQALVRGPADDAALEEARAALARALAADPRLAAARAELGKLYLRSGDVEKGVAELERAVALDPSDRAAAYQLVVALGRAGRREEAQAVAARVRGLIDRDRDEEIARNRYRLVRAEPSSR